MKYHSASTSPKTVLQLGRPLYIVLFKKHCLAYIGREHMKNSCCVLDKSSTPVRAWRALDGLKAVPDRPKGRS